MKHETILNFLFLGSAAFCSLGMGLFLDPLPASAVEIGAGGEAQIEEYLDTAGENLGALDFQFNSDQDGNRNIRIKLFGLQQLAFSAQSGFYGGLDFSAAPDTVTVSGSGRSGVYIDDSGIYQPCTLYDISGSLLQPKTLCTAPDFTVILRSDSDINYTFQSNAGFQGVSYWMTYGYTGRTYRITMGTRSGSYSEPNYGGSYINGLGVSINDTNQIPRLSDMNFSNISVTVCGTAQSVTLPPGTVDTSRPWDYYNNVLLPYMEEEFPGFEEYFVFPDGYYPQEPTEPITIPFLDPTAPNWDIVGGEIGTNPPGADDAVYDVSDPDQLGLPLPDPGFDKIQFSLSAFGDSIAFWFAFLGRVCDSLHITPVLTIALCLGAVGFILWKVGS